MSLRSLFLFSVLLFLGACTKKAPVDVSALTPEQLIVRGQSIYRSNCISCHNIDPRKEGTVGPIVWGSSLELLKLRVIHGKYPEGYQAKRATSQMPPMPYLESEITSLHEYLNSAIPQ